ncbi:elongation factor P hydroxylase [Pseudoalteromonas shioyasakiensis]|uniref:Elongation factor P hydroxylase n=2 Tax=Pseudoalteromonas TaxID=53246 RepID=A0ABT6U0K5_9GAMM|nr:elongation factor P hydroxylase [Pseudoalteromonas shioyasakiensis]NUJ21513.1 elongation factor P hydroxylase [Pseudoalteromonas sp. 0802]NUJ30602.1 elongation factor P hydroxylase [Pseudoalteromonas sp. 2103]NUJ33405.1 elongation factor P hydroxylase [Pseudoalteromonas sp. 1701]NUJ67471.1 elongation factor P hydroxylase [Pseudoalteromonas sp. 2102]
MNSSRMHQIADLIAIFESTFYQSHNTRLIKGDDEPIYLPADEQTPYHQIVFAHGFYASALHEIAHWLVAGKARRLKEDYGYWYCPDGRDKHQQAEFEAVEVKPQAIEWALSTAAGFDFNVSVDNLNGEQTCRFDFQARVHQQVLSFLASGFNQRTTALLKALSDFYKTPWPLSAAQFTWQRDFHGNPGALSDAV